MKEAALVRLRALQPGDDEEFLSMGRESRSFHARWTATVSTPAELAALRARCLSGDLETWLVERCADGALVGAVTLSERTRARATVGVRVGVSFARRGYMTEALGLLCERARALGLRWLDAAIQPTNVAAIALFERLCFRRSPSLRRVLRVGAEWLDHDVWTLAVDGYRRKNDAC